MAVNLRQGAELEQNQGHLGGPQREAGAHSMPSCLGGKYHEPDSNKFTSPARQQIDQKHSRFGVCSSHRASRGSRRLFTERPVS